MEFYGSLRSPLWKPMKSCAILLILSESDYDLLVLYRGLRILYERLLVRTVA